MKKMSLRLFATLMALLLVFGLAACGEAENKGEQANGGEATMTESTTTTESTGGDETTTEGTDGDETTTESTDESTTTKDEDDETTTTKDEDKKTSKTSKSKTSRSSTKSTTKSTTKTTGTSGDKAKSWADVKKEIPAGSSGKTLTVVDWNPTKEVPGMSKVLTKFTEETGIKVDYKIVTYNTYFTKLTSQVTAGNAPDAARLQNVSKQNLVNMQPINKLGYDFSDAAWDKNVIDLYTFNGNTYGVNMEGSPYYCPYLFYYNTRLIETYGLEDPYELWKDGKWTWEKVWDMCDEFLDEVEGDGFIGLSTMADFAYMRAYGTPPIVFNKKNNTFSHNLQNEKFIKSFQEFAKYYDKGFISQALTNNTAFDQGKLLFSISQGIAARKGSSYFNKLREQNAVAAVPLPVLKKGAKEYQILGEVQAFGVPKTAKNAKLVPYFLRFYFDPANYNMKTFFNVTHADEAIKHIRTTNPEATYDSTVISQENCGMDSSYFLDEVKQGGAANVAMYMETYKPVVDDAILQMNAFFASL